MDQKTITVVVAKDLEDLIPTFMTNRTKELETLRVALGAGDMQQLRHLGHRMKGVGQNFKSLTCGQVNLSVEMASNQASRSLSNDTP